ncbi:MAG: hypothetical protein ACI8PB_002728 [Desulforhopalus sp.]|jgi:hypothetical protein
MELNNSTQLQAATSKPPLQARNDSTSNQTQATDKNPSSTASYSVKISKEGKDASSKNPDPGTQPGPSDSAELNQEDVAQLTKLKARDVEVRTHEQAHLSAAGGYATGGASFSYQKGPDGQSYAVGGEVGIDLSQESDPSATIQKMQTVKRAALAPASPSSTDRQVAAQAEAIAAQARQEVLQVQQEELLHAKEGSTNSLESDQPENTSKNVSPSISSLKASISAYEQMAAM